MIFYYIDASAWVKRYWQETGTTWIQHLLSSTPNLVCSSLGIVEVTAAMVRKSKSERISATELNAMLQKLDDDWQRFFELHMTPEVTRMARTSARRYQLRGADAVHLASALTLRSKLGTERSRLILVTSDVELAHAARRARLAVLVPPDQI